MKELIPNGAVSSSAYSPRRCTIPGASGPDPPWKIRSDCRVGASGAAGAQQVRRWLGCSAVICTAAWSFRQRASLKGVRHRLHAFPRRKATVSVMGLLLALPSSPARAGPFVSFLTDVLPIREAQRAVAKIDAELRDGVNRFTEVTISPIKNPEVPDASGSEEAVLLAGREAAAAAGLDRKQIDSREAELEEKEPSRLRGRAEAGLFETEMLGSVTYHLVANLDKPAFKAYCTWKAYGEALLLTEPEKAAKFRRLFGRRLLAGLLKDVPSQPPQIKASAQEATNIINQLQAAFNAFIAAGLCTKATLQVDDVLVDIWASGGSLELVLPILVEGDPLVDAQLLLSEETMTPVLPDPIKAALVSWLEEAGPGYVSLETYYVNSRWRGRTEYSNMVYVPKQRLFQLTLHR